MYIADTQDNAIRKVAASNGIINTIIGHPPSNCSGVSGDGGPAIDSGICWPEGVTLDRAGNLYVAESSASRIRKVVMPTFPPATATAAPVFNVAPGTYATSQIVSITDSTPGAAIYLTVSARHPQRLVRVTMALST